MSKDYVLHVLLEQTKALRESAKTIAETVSTISKAHEALREEYLTLEKSHFSLQEKHNKLTEFVLVDLQTNLKELEKTVNYNADITKTLREETAGRLQQHESGIASFKQFLDEETQKTLNSAEALMRRKMFRPKE